MKRLSSTVFALVAAWTIDGASAQTANQDERPPSISYSSLDEALEALRAKPGVKFREQTGWIVAEDDDGLVLWLLTPPGHPAYPSIVRRNIVNRDGGAYIETVMRCFASKAVCDQYFGGN